MNVKKIVSAVLTIGLGISLATSASAYTLVEKAQFTEAETATVVKHHGKPFIVTIKDDGSLNVYRGNRKGKRWKLITPTASSIANLPTNVVSTNNTRIFQGKLYLGLTTEDGAEVWSIPLRLRPATWAQVGSDGVSVDGTSLTTLFKKYAKRSLNNADGGVMAFVNTEDGAQLVSTEDGSNWQAIGDAGLGEDIEEVVDGARKRIDGVRYYYIATNDGEIYRSELEDLTAWELVTTEFSSGTPSVTDMRTYRGKMYVSYVTYDGIEVWFTDDGENFTKIDDLIEEFGISNFVGATNARFGSFGGPLLITTEDEVNGGDIARITKPLSANPGLEMKVENGEDRWYTHGVPVRGRIMLGNNSDGVKVYRVKK